MQRNGKIPVAILGATGTVGQRFIQLIDSHPWFELGAIAASDRSSGKPYREAAAWKLPGSIPAGVENMTVRGCLDELDCPIVFSGLSSQVAGEIEQEFARRGCWVFSNAKNHRMDSDVPLIISELNPAHLQMIPLQRKKRGWTGAIVTNPNCSTIVLALALGPLHRSFGVSEVHAVTLQAVSGAGYPGVASLDILGNVVPFIRGEEEKIEAETAKILGDFHDGAYRPAPIRISAHTNRVPVLDGHMACVSVKLAKPCGSEEVRACWESFQGPPQELDLPTAPERAVVVLPGEDRPQPLRDVGAGSGMSVTVGRLRTCPLLDFRFVALGHNTIRGAAGASLLNAELTLKQGLLGRQASSLS